MHLLAPTVWCSNLVRSSELLALIVLHAFAQPQTCFRIAAWNGDSEIAMLAKALAASLSKTCRCAFISFQFSVAFERLSTKANRPPRWPSGRQRATCGPECVCVCPSQPCYMFCPSHSSFRRPFLTGQLLNVLLGAVCVGVCV